MAAYWHDDGTPAWAGGVIRYSFDGRPEIHAEAPRLYSAAREDMMRRERILGAAYYRHNAELAHQFYEIKKPWYL